MSTEGRHLILDIWYEHYVEHILMESIDRIVHETFQVVQCVEHAFHPQGVTKVYILTESHVAIHTYPEHAYVSVDIYICNPAYDLAQVAQVIRDTYTVLHYRQQILERGQPDNFLPNRETGTRLPIPVE